MLNQVPSDVQLTEVIEPLPVKPQSPALLFTGNDTLKFTGQVRVRTTLYHTFSHVPLKETFLIFASRFQFWNMSESSTRSIKLLWADRAGTTHAAYTDVLAHSSNMAATNQAGDQTVALWYQIGAFDKNFTPLDEQTGISKFWFEVDEGDGSAVRTEDQDGAAFVLQDAVMLADSTCNNGTIARIDIAVSTRMRRSFCEP